MAMIDRMRREQRSSKNGRLMGQRPTFGLTFELTGGASNVAIRTDLLFLESVHSRPQVFDVFMDVRDEAKLHGHSPTIGAF